MKTYVSEPFYCAICGKMIKGAQGRSRHLTGLPHLTKLAQLKAKKGGN